MPALEAGRQGLVRDLAADEEAIELEFYPPKTVNDRRIVRLRASDVWIDWMNFNLWREPTAGKYPLILTSHNSKPKPIFSHRDCRLAKQGLQSV